MYSHNCRCSSSVIVLYHSSQEWGGTSEHGSWSTYQDCSPPRSREVKSKARVESLVLPEEKMDSKTQKIGLYVHTFDIRNGGHGKVPMNMHGVVTF